MRRATQYANRPKIAFVAILAARVQTGGEGGLVDTLHALTQRFLSGSSGFSVRL